MVDFARLGVLTLPKTKASRTSGNVTVGTAGINVDTALDLVIPAAVGDVIEFTISGAAGTTAAIDLIFDVATVVAGSPVNYFGNWDGTLEHGVWAWFVTNIVPTQSIQGSAWRTLVAGDISNGTVTLRVRAVASGASATIFASAQVPFTVMAQNLGR